MRLMIDDKETEQIGKLIDAGYPELASQTLRSRWRWKVMLALVWVIPPVVVALVRIPH